MGSRFRRRVRRSRHAPSSVHRDVLLTLVLIAVLGMWVAGWIAENAHRFHHHSGDGHNHGRSAPSTRPGEMPVPWAPHTM